MVMTMTQEQKTAFDKGVKFSFELFKSYIEKNCKQKCKTEREKYAFLFDILGFVESLEGNIVLYQRIDEAVKKEHISEDDKEYFEDGIREHNGYVKFCLQNADIETIDVHLREYFFGKISAIPNKIYLSFEEFADI